MQPEDYFYFFKSEFVRDEFDSHCQIIFNYLELNPLGIKINDIKMLNTSISFLVENMEDIFIEAFIPIVNFFDVASKGFLKEKNFDDKINNDGMIELLNTIARIIDKTNIIFDLEELEVYIERVRVVLLLAFKATAFVFDYLDGKITFHNSSQTQQELKKLSKVEYFTIKRSKNLRECEKGISDFKNCTESSMTSSEQSLSKAVPVDSVSNRQFDIYEQSNLPIVFIEFLQKHSSTMNELAILVLEIKRLTSTQMSLSKKLVSLGFLKDIVYIIYDNKQRFREYFLKLAFEILWNYVEMLEKEAVTSIESEDILLIFKEIFCIVLSSGFKLDDKILRNELIVMINNLLESGKLTDYVHEQSCELKISDDDFSLEINAHNFRNQSLLKILLCIASYDEMFVRKDTKSINKKKKKLFDLSNEDLQFKKLVINAIHLIVRNSINPQILQIIEKSMFIEIILMYINSEESTSQGVNQFSQPQLKDLQSECLGALEEIALKFTKKLLSENILQILMKLIARLKGDPRVISGLKILLRLLEVSHQEVQQQFGETSLFDIVLEYLNSAESLVGLNDDDIIRTRTLSFMIIAKSCNGSPTNQKIFSQKGGVETIIVYLKNQKLYKSEKNILLMVAVFSALWNCVIGNPKNEDVFLESDGFFILMEFLEVSPRVNLKMALGAISGIMENRKSFHYFEEWVSSTSSLMSTQLLIRLYQEEDKKFSVEYKDGVLVNRFKPLNPAVARSMKDFRVKKGYSKKAFGKLINALKSSTEEHENQLCSKHILVSVEAILIKFLKENCEFIDLRRSIFAILYRIGFDRHKISKEDAQILIIIQNYPQLRVGEIWSDIKENFFNKKIELTLEDACFTDRNIQEFQKLVDFCMKQQEYIAKEKRNQQEEELTKFYDLIRHQKKYVR